MREAPPYFLREKPQGLGCIPREAKMGGASLVTKTFLSSKGQGKNCLAKVSFICMRISLYTDVYRLSVNKSPAVILYHPALDGLWRENRGSVNRLYENKNNHFHVKGFALTPTIWEPGTGYTHSRFETEDSGHSETAKLLEGNESAKKKVKKKTHYT